MKRSEALAPLSRDHHVALVVARELSRATADTADAATHRFVSFLSEHELAHFASEERVLLPAIPADEPGPGLARRLLDDHAYLRGVLGELRSGARNASPELAHELGTRLRAHVQMEERELFPYLEGSLDPATLEEIGRKLSHGPDE
jgi:hypothetical protein